MKFKAIIEKLDWQGEVKKTVEELNDESFNLEYNLIMDEFIKTGKISLNKLTLPSHEIVRKIAPAKSCHSFNDYDVGMRICAGEYIEGIGIQFCLANNNKSMTYRWIETNKDLLN